MAERESLHTDSKTEAGQPSPYASSGKPAHAPNPSQTAKGERIVFTDWASI